MRATPGEVGNALADVEQRPLWELKLKTAKKVRTNVISLEYVTSKTIHEVEYKFAALPKADEHSVPSFLINELILLNGGVTRHTN